MLDYKELIYALIGCIERNIKGKPDYCELEKTAGFTYHHIREIFHRFTRVTLSRYILSRKIANAAFEIRHSDKSIMEIAFEYEFTNPDTFTRAFRRDTGLTPSQFRKSSYLCGRRVICPGVYAPVIVGLTRFTLPKLKEVNEMATMSKTTDSCILYGVPKIYYGRTVDGHKQCTPFPMCLQSVLNYMGQNISYAEIMAYSGAAFRQRWDSKGWNIGAGDIRFTYENHLKPFELAFKGAGRTFKISENPPKSITKNDAIALIKSELDCGRPVIALGVVGPPEACIVTGYKNNGETLLGWSLFQDFWGGCEFDESGYFIKENWWDDTEAIMSIGEEIGHRTTDKEVLENALMLMTTEKMPTYGGNDIFYGGQAAYEAWAKALEAENFPNKLAEGVNPDDVKGSQDDAQTMMGEGRGFAAMYMEILAEKYPSATKELNECADLLRKVSSYGHQMWEAQKNGGGLQDKKVRAQLATLARQAAQHEKKACEILKQAINAL